MSQSILDRGPAAALLGALVISLALAGFPAAMADEDAAAMQGESRIDSAADSAAAAKNEPQAEVPERPAAADAGAQAASAGGCCQMQGMHAGEQGCPMMQGTEPGEGGMEGSMSCPMAEGDHGNGACGCPMMQGREHGEGGMSCGMMHGARAGMQHGKDGMAAMEHGKGAGMAAMEHGKGEAGMSCGMMHGAGSGMQGGAGCPCMMMQQGGPAGDAEADAADNATRSED